MVYLVSIMDLMVLVENTKAQYYLALTFSHNFLDKNSKTCRRLGKKVNDAKSVCQKKVTER